MGDDRNKTQKKLTPELNCAAIDEAHKYNLRTIAHVYDLEDAKGLVRADIEGFTHLVRDTQVDEEFLQLLRAHPGVFVTPNLGVTSRAMDPGRRGWTIRCFTRPFLRPFTAERIAPLTSRNCRVGRSRPNVRRLNLIN